MKRLAAKLRARFASMFAPAEENAILLMEQAASVAKWVVGVGGVTFVIAISFSTSAYTSFIQAYDKCQPRTIASDAILAGRIYALLAALGVAFALSGLTLPHITRQLWYSWSVGRSRRKDIPFPNLESWRPTKFTTSLSITLVIMGSCVISFVPVEALEVSSRQTSGGLLHYIEQIDARCLKEHQESEGARKGRTAPPTGH